MKQKSKILIGLLTATALVALSGCAGSNGGGGDVTDKSSPIKIGAILPLTGGYSKFGSEVRQGAEAAVENINNDGGVNGQKIELVVKDDKTSPDQSVIAYNDLVGEEVAGIVGSTWSNSAMATISLAERNKTPYVSTAGDSEQLSPVRKYVFVAPPTASIAAEALMEYFKNNDIARVAVTYGSDYAFAIDGWKHTQKFAEKYGVEVEMIGEFAMDTTDFTSLLTRFRQDKSEYLLAWGGGPPYNILTKQFAEADLTGKKLVLSHSASTNSYLAATGAASEGVILATPLPSIPMALPESPTRSSNEQMIETYQKLFGEAPTTFSANGYSAVLMLAEAIKKAKSVDAEAIQQALETLSVVTPFGPRKFSAKDHLGMEPWLMAISTVEDGKYVVTDTAMKELEGHLKK